MDTDMQVKKEVHQGRWGFYPCDWATYQKLKKISQEYQKGLRQHFAWCRWLNKLPHNRVIRRWKRNESGQRIGCEIIGPAPEPQVNRLFLYLEKNYSSFSKIDLLVEYRKARYPAVTAEEVKPLLLTLQQIDILMGELEE